MHSRPHRRQRLCGARTSPHRTAAHDFFLPLIREEGNTKGKNNNNKKRVVWTTSRAQTAFGIFCTRRITVPARNIAHTNASSSLRFPRNAHNTITHCGKCGLLYNNVAQPRSQNKSVTAPKGASEGQGGSRRVSAYVAFLFSPRLPQKKKKKLLVLKGQQSASRGDGIRLQKDTVEPAPKRAIYSRPERSRRDSSSEVGFSTRNVVGMPSGRRPTG